jgi:hypothetical protein
MNEPRHTSCITRLVCSHVGEEQLRRRADDPGSHADIRADVRRRRHGDRLGLCGLKGTVG